jgi:hypothetical protein
VYPFDDGEYRGEEQPEDRYMRKGGCKTQSRSRNMVMVVMA